MRTSIETAANTILVKINDIVVKKGSCIVALEGRCASGKSTMAKAIQERIDCNVFHLDDFFLTPDLRTPEREEEPGGNVDYVRFKEEILLPTSEGKPCVYAPYNCVTRTMGDSHTVSYKPVTIMEGSYSLHPTLVDMYDLKVFFNVDPDVQEKRLEKRGSNLAMFKTKWIPLEETYLDTYKVMAETDLRFTLIDD